MADKWTIVIRDVLAEKGTLRFIRLGKELEGIGQKMLAQNPRGMERDGLVRRAVYAVAPSKVEYALTVLGLTLGAAFYRVWVWAAENLEDGEKARATFDANAD